MRVYDGAHLRATLHNAHHCKLMVTFDFRKKGKSDFGPDAASRGFDRAGFAQLMIKTRANDWFINDDTPQLLTILPDIAQEFDAVHLLGFSMGGYGALRFAKVLRADHLIAVSPQISIAREVVPFDRRYRDAASGFDPVAGTVPPQNAVAGAVVFDPFVRNDRLHAELIARDFPQLQVIRLPFGGHPATRVLRDGGKAGIIQRAAMGLAAPASIAKAHKALRRASAPYWDAFAQKADRQHPSLARYAKAQSQHLRENGASPP